MAVNESHVAAVDYEEDNGGGGGGINEDHIRFITQGVLLTTISILGVVGNSMTVYVLVKPSAVRSGENRRFGGMLRTRENNFAFSHLLTGLASFDAAFLVMAIFTFGLKELSHGYKRNVFHSILPVIYGLLHTFRTGSVYSTIAVTMERFFAIVFPFREFNKVKRCLIPFAVVFAFTYNIPKYFELRIVFDDATNTTVHMGTPLRLNPIYINYYILWSKLLLIELIPHLTIVILNSFILIKIVKSSKFRNGIMRNLNNTSSLMAATADTGGTNGDGGATANNSHAASDEQIPKDELLTPAASGPHSGSHMQHHHSSSSPLLQLVFRPQIRFFEQQRQEHKLGVVLVAISVLFICCHAPSVIPDLYEVWCQRDAHETCEIPLWFPVLVDISHLLVCFNSSANFLIYMLGGEKFRRAFVGTFFPCCIASPSAHGSNGDFQASFYSRTTDDNRLSTRINRSTTVLAGDRNGGNRASRAQRRTMSLRAVTTVTTINTVTAAIDEDIDNESSVEMDRLCPNNGSLPNNNKSFRSERAIRMSDDECGGGGSGAA